MRVGRKAHPALMWDSKRFERGRVGMDEQRDTRAHSREVPFGGAHEVIHSDYPDENGASHSYSVLLQTMQTGSEGAFLRFQQGPIGEVGVNGISDEALFAILVDRLQGFQSGPLRCRENAVALTHLETAVLWLLKRKLDRAARGVEGSGNA